MHKYIYSSISATIKLMEHNACLSYNI